MLFFIGFACGICACLGLAFWAAEDAPQTALSEAEIGKRSLKQIEKNIYGTPTAVM
jgi:hypothetical protein